MNEPSPERKIPIQISRMAGKFAPGQKILDILKVPFSGLKKKSLAK
jgi:hypothetical protein